jgi:hypothetical protein
MNIQHEIISFDAASASVLVRFFSDSVPEGLTYNIDLPIQEGRLPSQEEIDEVIRAYRPVGQLERLAQIPLVEIPEFLLAKVVQEPIVPEGSHEQSA